MDALPAQWPALLALVFFLGMQHGFDPDHLATIDGLTRLNADDTHAARWSGVWFSLGHGLMVMSVALLVALLSRHWKAPLWLEDLGAWISIFFLSVLGVLNLISLVRTPADQDVPLTGLKTRWLTVFRNNSHPLLVGALFALSFDTLSQTALFSIAAHGMGGWALAFLLGAVFTLGMLATDGINGLWIARMIHRSNAAGSLASRVLSLAVACMSLLVALYGAARYFSPEVAHWGETRAFGLGLVVVLGVLASYVFGMWLNRRGRASHA